MRVSKGKKAYIFGGVIFGLGFLLLVFGFHHHTLQKYRIEKLANSYPVMSYEYGEDGMSISRSFSGARPSYWVEFSELSPSVWGAMVISEDWAFFQHHGFDSLQLWRSLRDYFWRGSRLRGASTITQQLAKNLFLSPERSFTRKLRELSLSLELERRHSKEFLLETYLNIVEWGEGIVGIEQAALRYFEKRAKNLSPKEAAFLAYLLPSPIRYFEEVSKNNGLTEFAQERVDWILKGMLKAGFVDEQQYLIAEGRHFSFAAPQSRESEALPPTSGGQPLEKLETESSQKHEEIIDQFIEESFQDL